MAERRRYWNEDAQRWEDITDRGRPPTVTPPPPLSPPSRSVPRRAAPSPRKTRLPR